MGQDDSCTLASSLRAFISTWGCASRIQGQQGPALYDKHCFFLGNYGWQALAFCASLSRIERRDTDTLMKETLKWRWGCLTPTITGMPLTN